MPDSHTPNWKAILELLIGREATVHLRPEWSAQRLIEQGLDENNKPVQVTHDIPSMGVLERIEGDVLVMRQTISAAGDTARAYVPLAAIALVGVVSDLATPGSILSLGK